MNRHVMQVPQISLQGSCKLGDGAYLLHPLLDAPREIRPKVDTSAESSAGLLRWREADGSDPSHHPDLDHPKPSAKRTKPSRLPLGYLRGFYDQVVKLAAGGRNARRPHGPELGHLQIRRPLNLRSWVDAGAAHPANARSVTQTFLTTGKPVDTGKARNVSKTARIAGKAGNPALAANTPFRGDFPQSEEKSGDSLYLRKCGGRP